jgi:hypothetical protein
MILADNLTAATDYWVGLGQVYRDDRPTRATPTTTAA